VWLSVFPHSLCINHETAMTDDRLAYTMMKLKNETSRISLFGIIYFSREYYSRCSLGDTTNNDACYEKALEVSNNRSARAKVSLCICLIYCAYILHVCFYDIIKFINSHFKKKIVFLCSQRSLARSAYNRGDYETSKILWCVLCIP
jgi:hypothetical protein